MTSKYTQHLSPILMWALGGPHVLWCMCRAGRQVYVTNSFFFSVRASTSLCYSTVAIVDSTIARVVTYDLGRWSVKIAYLLYIFCINFFYTNDHNPQNGYRAELGFKMDRFCSAKAASSDAPAPIRLPVHGAINSASTMCAKRVPCKPCRARGLACRTRAIDRAIDGVDRGENRTVRKGPFVPGKMHLGRERSLSWASRPCRETTTVSSRLADALFIYLDIEKFSRWPDLHVDVMYIQLLLCLLIPVHGHISTHLHILVHSAGSWGGTN